MAAIRSITFDVRHFACVILGAAVLSFGNHNAGASEPEIPKYEGNCTTAGCHDEFTKRLVVHSPVETGACDACHEKSPGDAHKFTSSLSGAALCTECHEEEKFQGKVVHSPVAQGQCDACHDPHGGAVKNLLKAENIEKLCAECHEEVVKEHKFTHGPVAAGSCTACHQPHASDQAKLLPQPQRDLCLDCHTTVQDRLSGSKSVHQPVQDGCTACHNPHGADNPMLLAAADSKQLCLDCHTEIEEYIDSSKVQHEPMLAAGACVTCHDAHASAEQALLVKPSMELCLACHNQELRSNDAAVADIGKYLQANPHHHGPIQSKDCAACHNPHGGPIRSLLTRNYPEKFYAAFDEQAYALCFECHEADAFTDKETDNATGFRNGLQNLHYLHVNRTVKGRTCRACHDPHASKNDKHIAESVPFGKWRIPLGFESTSTGGSCQPGCHVPQRYDRESPVINGAAR